MSLIACGRTRRHESRWPRRRGPGRGPDFSSLAMNFPTLDNEIAKYLLVSGLAGFSECQQEKFLASAPKFSSSFNSFRISKEIQRILRDKSYESDHNLADFKRSLPRAAQIDDLSYSKQRTCCRLPADARFKRIFRWFFYVVTAGRVQQ